MPPGIYHESCICWDELDVWTQSKLIEYHRIRSYDESGGDYKPPKPPPTPRRRRR